MSRRPVIVQSCSTSKAIRIQMMIISPPIAKITLGENESKTITLKLDRAHDGQPTLLQTLLWPTRNIEVLNQPDGGSPLILGNDNRHYRQTARNAACRIFACSFFIATNSARD